MQTYKNNQSVLVVIYSLHSNQILMLRRKDDPSFWQSVTGTIEMNEQPFMTAIREVKEETGIDIIAQNLALYDCNQSVKFEIFPQFRYKYAPLTIYGIEHWFLLNIPNEIVPELTEHLEYRWVSVEEAISLTKSPNNANAIRQYFLGD